MNRRRFLQGILAAAAASKVNVAFSLIPNGEHIATTLVTTPYVIYKQYQIEYAAMLWAVTMTVGEVVDGKALMDTQINYSTFVYPELEKTTDFEGIFKEQALHAFDDLLSEKYGKYKPVEIAKTPNRQTRREL